MVKKLFILYFLLVFCFSLHSDDIKLGSDIKIEKVTKISEILSNPDTFVDKKVRIEGKVISVDKQGGHWATIQGDKESQKITVLVKGHHLHFPGTIKDKFAIIEGTVYKIELTKEQVVKWKERLAKKNKEKFDPSLIKEGIILYRINPSGCIIKM